MVIISIDSVHNVDVESSESAIKIDFIDTRGSTYRIELSTSDAEMMFSELQYQLSKVNQKNIGRLK